MPGQGHHRLLFVLTVLWCHLPVMRTEQYVYDQIEKPKTPKFEQCHMFILASIYTCYASAASTYNIDETEVLHKWPSRPSECCAVWNARDCIKVKMNTYADCQDPQVLAYHQAIEDKYIEMGCANYVPSHYDCKNGLETFHRSNGWLQLLTAFISVILIIGVI